MCEVSISSMGLVLYIVGILVMWTFIAYHHGDGGPNDMKELESAGVILGIIWPPIAVIYVISFPFCKLAQYQTTRRNEKKKSEKKLTELERSYKQEKDNADRYNKYWNDAIHEKEVAQKKLSSLQLKSRRKK